MQEKQSSAPFDTPLRKWHNYTSSIGKSLLLDVLARERRRALPIRPPMSRERRRAARECELGEHVERREATKTCGSIRRTAARTGEEESPSDTPPNEQGAAQSGAGVRIGGACREARSDEDMRKYKKKEKPRLARERIDFPKYKKELVPARRRHAEV